MADEWNYEGTITWAGGVASPGELYPVFVRKALPNFFQADNPAVGTVDLFDPVGGAINVFLERVGLPLLKGGYSRNSEIEDPSLVKFVTRLWPIITGTIGDVLTIQVGMQENTPDDPVVWGISSPFIIGVDEAFDVLLSGRYLALRFASANMNPWTLTSYKIDYELLGTQ